MDWIWMLRSVLVLGSATQTETRSTLGSLGFFGCLLHLATAVLALSGPSIYVKVTRKLKSVLISSGSWAVQNLV